MNIGIIGSGGLGSNVAHALARKGLSATISNHRGPASLAPLVAELGPTIKAGTAAEAASADIVLVALRWVGLGQALRGLPAWNGRIVIDGTNPVEFLDPDSPDAKDPSNPLAAYGIRAHSARSLRRISSRSSAAMDIAMSARSAAVTRRNGRAPRAQKDSSVATGTNCAKMRSPLQTRGEKARGASSVAGFLHGFGRAATCAVARSAAPINCLAESAASIGPGS